MLYLAVIVLSTGVVWKGSGRLESSAESLARHYRLPPVVQGTIIAAVGSSFPELSTTVLSTLVHGQFELGVSVIVGSAIFNILVIPGVAGIASARLNVDRLLVYRDAQFYITSVAVLLLTFSLTVIYFPIDGPGLQGEMTRTIALIPVLLYGLYLFLQLQETLEYQQEEEHGDQQLSSVWSEWLKLGAGLVLIVIGVEGLVRSAIFLGDYFHTPSFLWGVTVVAAATSIPDAFVSVRLARQGEGVVSLANVLGSNVFDLLVAIPVGVLLVGSATINFSVAVPLMFALTLATILLFAFLRTDLTLTVIESWLLIATYAAFVLWMAMETVGWSNWIVK